MFNAEDVLQEAREQHPAFDEFRTPDSVLFRHLNRYTDELYRRVVEKNSTHAVSVLEQALPLDPFEDGIALPAGFIHFLGGHVSVVNGITTELRIVPYRSRFDPSWYAPVYMVGGVVHLCGTTRDWPDGTIYLHYVPAPALPATGADPVPLPDSAQHVLINELAYWMGRRNLSEDNVPVPVADLHAAWKNSEEEFLVWVAQQSRSERALVKEEW